MPHHRYTLPPKQAKIVLKCLFEQNKRTICGHLVTPYILIIKILWPNFSFQKFDPQCISEPPSEENAVLQYLIKPKKFSLIEQ